MRRVTDVLDVWFDSGSMSFAQVHYPFENKDWFDNHFPGDFIVEYIGQTRGSAFKNKGVQLLLDAVVDFLPSPVDVPPVEGHLPFKENDRVERKPDDADPFSALAFKDHVRPVRRSTRCVSSAQFSGGLGRPSTRCGP